MAAVALPLGRVGPKGLAARKAAAAATGAVGLKSPTRAANTPSISASASAAREKNARLIKEKAENYFKEGAENERIDPNLSVRSNSATIKNGRQCFPYPVLVFIAYPRFSLLPSPSLWTRPKVVMYRKAADLDHAQAQARLAMLLW